MEPGKPAILGSLVSRPNKPPLDALHGWVQRAYPQRMSAVSCSLIVCLLLCNSGIRDGVKLYTLGSFTLQPCSANANSYTLTLYNPSCSVVI